MKALSLALFTLLLAFSLTASAQAGQRQVNGALIGAGGGALLGQAIGHNTRSTVVGSAVGSVVGFIIGNEIAHNQYRHDTLRSRRLPVRYERHFRGHGYRQPRTFCRKNVTVDRWHGQVKRRVTTTCWTTPRHQPHRDRFGRNWR